MSQVVGNKLIVKNTLFLYARMFLVLGINLYISRVVLQELGITDYGVYNVVGGIVVLFSYMNSAFSLASTRFLSYEMHNGIDKLSLVFNTSVQIQLIFSIFVLLLSETIGLWLINNKLVIPSERMVAAHWVYQLSVISTILSIIRVPYESSITSHERFHIYAILSIVEVLMKLIVVLILAIVTFDKLIFYAIGIFIVTLISFILRIIYCRKNFEETKIKPLFSIDVFKNIFFFTGWNFFGATAGVSVSQGLNFILNIFFGPVVNAARGIAIQVEGAVNQFVSNINTAVGPQIVKRYSEGDTHGMMNLVYFSSKISYFLLMIISFPILCDTYFILNLWLGEVPEYSVIFTQLELIYILVLSLTHSINMSAQASGNIKWFQIVEGVIMLLNLPISYCFFYLGLPPRFAFITLSLMAFIAFWAKLFVLRSIINFSIKDYFRKVFSRILVISLASIALYVIMAQIKSSDFVTFVVKSFCSSIILIVLAWVVLLNSYEKVKIKEIVVNYISKLK